MPELRTQMDRLLGAHRAGRPLALLFDYDGTLVPIVQHPALAKLPPGTRELLRRLGTQQRVVLGILSGRRLDDLKDMVGLTEICYSGVSGLELELDGLRIAHSRAARGLEIMAGLAAPLRQLAEAYPGAWVEDKRLGLTLHYRAAKPGDIEELRTRATRLLRSFGEEVRTVDVAMAIEITPALGWTKGSAVWAITAHAGHGALPLYAGDEANDREALQAAITLGGVAIGVGPRAPAVAQVRLPDAAGLVNLLFGLTDALDQAARPPVANAPGSLTASGR
jgi:trehalose 6-phosphate phosphatase